MARLGNIAITPAEQEALVVLAKKLDSEHATRKHKWLFRCMTHQYFALYWNRQDMIRCKCWQCPHFRNNQCFFDGEPTDEIDVRLYKAAMQRGRICCTVVTGGENT